MSLTVENLQKAYKILQFMEDITIMQSNTPALDKQEHDRRIDRVKKCGENRGPHDYIPIIWRTVENEEYVTKMMCRVCFVRVDMKTLYSIAYEAQL